MPHPEFIGLVQSLLATAEAALGEFTPTTARARNDGLLETPQRARQTAERSLRLLTMLAEKTRGNLDRTEAELLTEAIASIRSRLAS
ncbi:DUF1844 domain-containing protein [Deinococcus peraridilitoris]|nr:DUF1844 domain-containing protein [Deinococcus peraridilitoris]